MFWTPTVVLAEEKSEQGAKKVKLSLESKVNNTAEQRCGALSLSKFRSAGGSVHSCNSYLDTHTETVVENCLMERK